VGQLGLGDNNPTKENYRNIPVYIPNQNFIIQISTGYGHSILLDKDGQIFSFGFNNVIIFIL
jgi:alpha-tubulin suppressor-like RCC1 family protein